MKSLNELTYNDLKKLVDIEEGYKTGNFVAKTISGLDNLEKFEQVSVSKPDDSGYNSVVAITKDGEIFEILPNN